MREKLLSAITILLLPAATTALPQSTTATLFGVVRDSTSAVVPQARVTARNVLTSFSRGAQTDETGNYLITNLPVGDYSLTAERDGFRRFIQEGITLVVNQNARVDVTLTIGAVSESVSVTAQPPDVDTRSSTIGELVDRTRIQELPLNGRNAMALARVIPGVTTVGAPTAPTNGRNGPRVVVGGARDTQNEFRLDGTSHQNLTHNSGLNLPSPDALQEFKILTNNYGAEYGRNGGGVFVAVTRAGTNEFHG